MDDLLNLYIGKRIRMRRKALGLSQAEVAARAGMQFRQIHKYECCENRTSAVVLWKLACALEVGVHYFFEGWRDGALAAPDRPAAEPVSAMLQ
jgi:transcriptional regulator with XRE-family HTH domain